MLMINLAFVHFHSKDIQGKISDTLTQVHVQGCGFLVETIVIIFFFLAHEGVSVYHRFDHKFYLPCWVNTELFKKLWC